MRGRVLHLIDTGGPGGAETVFADLACRLADSGWSPVAVVPEPGWLEDRLEREGIDPVHLPNRGSFAADYLWRLVQLLRRSGADLLHAHLLASGVYGSLAAALRGIPAVCTFHGEVDVEGTGLVDRVKYRLLDRPSNRVVFVSEFLHGELSDRMGLERAHTRVIPNGIDPERFAISGNGSFRRQLGVRDGEILVGAVGNVRPAKDYDVFLRAAARLRIRDDRYRFVVVGEHDHPLHEELRAERTRLGLDECMAFAGLREDIPEVLADLDVFVLTSSSEGFSLSTIEAMAAGLPVVATRCGGPEEILTDGEDGYLVEPGSPDAVAAAVSEIAGDPERARRIGRAARRTAKQKFSAERMVTRYGNLYEECLP